MTVSLAGAQSYRPTVSILGDSYSTFENYLACDSNEVWYFKGKQKRTDVTDVEQTWWHQLITKNRHSRSVFTRRLCPGHGHSHYCYCKNK